MTFNAFKLEYRKLRPDADDEEVQQAYAAHGIDIGEAFGRGVMGGMYNTLGGFGTVGEMLGLPTADWAEKQYKKGEEYALPPELQGYIWDKPELALDPRWLAATTGQVFPTMVPSMGAGALTAKGASLIPRLAPYARALGAGVGGVMGGAQEAAGAYRETGNLPQALTYGAASSVLNALPMFKFMDKGPLAGRVLSGAAWEAATEYAEEPTQALIEGRDVSQAMKQGLNVIPGSFMSALMLGAPTAAMAQHQNARQDAEAAVAAAPTLQEALTVWTAMSEGESLIDSAKKRFGTTAMPSSAGYILPDGSMLDFSGQSEGSGSPMRSYDHRDIVLSTPDTFIDTVAKGSDPTEAMFEWMGRTGAIRWTPEVWGAETVGMPTADQITTLLMAAQANRGGITLEYVDPQSLETVDTHTFREASRIDIERFFRHADNMKKVGKFKSYYLHGTPPGEQWFRTRGKAVTGAPPGRRAVADVQPFVDSLKAPLRNPANRGTQTVNWYGEAGEMIRKLTRGNPELMEDVTRLVALLSPQNEISDNWREMVETAYEIAQGRLTKTHLKMLPSDFRRLLAVKDFNKSQKWIGNKVENFYRNIHDAAFGRNDYPDAVTLDLWMAKMMGYKGDRFTDLQYQFAANALREAVLQHNLETGEKLTPAQAQAMIWSDMRRPAIGAKQAMSFAEEASRGMQNVTFEVVPSTAFEDGRRLTGATPEVKLGFTRAALSILLDDKGNDRLAAAIGIPLYYERIGTGGYDGAITPNVINGVQAMRLNSHYDTSYVHAYARALQYLFRQDAVPWFRADPTLNIDNPGVAAGVSIKFNAALDVQSEDLFFAALREHMGQDAGYTKLDNNEIAVINYGDTDNHDFLQLLDDFVDKYKSDLNISDEIVHFGAEGEYITHDWTQDPQGQALRAELETYQGRSPGSPNLLRQLDSWREAFDAIAARAEGEVAANPIIAPLAAERIDAQGMAGEVGKLVRIQSAAKEAERFLGGFTDIQGDLLAKVNIDPFLVTDIDIAVYAPKMAKLPDYPDIPIRVADADEARAITTILKTARTIAPLDGAIANVDHIGIMQTPENKGGITVAQFVPAQHGYNSTLLFNDNMLQALYSPTLSPVVRQAMVSAVMHELGHAIDTNTTGDTSSHLYQSPPFYIEPVSTQLIPDPTTDLGARVVYDKRSTGKIMAELLDVFQSKRARANGLFEFLVYPLIDIPHVALRGEKIPIIPDLLEITITPKTVDDPLAYSAVSQVVGFELNRIQGELFAQLHTLFYTNPILMQSELPLSYAFMEKIYDLETQAKGPDQLDRGIREAIRASSPKQRTKGFERANWQTIGPDAGGGYKVWAASASVGAGEGAEPLYTKPQAPVQRPPFVEASAQGVAPAQLAELAKRGKQTQDAAVRLAHVLGINQKELDEFQRRTIGMTRNSEELAQAAELFEMQWEAAKRQFSAMAQKVESGNMSDNDWVSAEELFDNLNASQAQFFGVRGETGRALSIFNRIKDTTRLADAVQMILDGHGGRDMLEAKIKLLASLEKSGEGLRAVRSEMAVTRADQLLEWYINSLVSGIPTHVVNVTSNLLVSLLEDFTRFVAAGIGMFHGGDKVSMEEAVMHAAATIPGAVAGFKALAGAVADENHPLQFLGKIDQPRRHAIPGLAGKIIRLPTRFLGAEDAFFKTMAMTKELYALAVRQSRSTGESVQDIIDNPPQELMDKAWDEGMQRTFTSRPGDIARALLSLRRKHKLINIIFPFVTTPANIVTHALAYSPAGLLFKQVRADLKAGGAKRDVALARMATGSSIGAAVMGLAAMGLITGAPPDDPNKRRLWYATGMQPYSIKVGNTWYSYSRLEPVGMLFGVSADAWQLADRIGVDEADKIATMVIGSAFHNLLSKTYLRGLSDLVNAMTDPEQYGERWVKSMVTGVATPVFLSYTAKATDPYLREAETILDAIKARVPGLSQTLEPRLDVFGRERINEGHPVYRFFSPAYVKEHTKDPVASELLRLEVSMPEVGKQVRGVDLTTVQRNEMKRLLGGASYNAVNRVIQSPAYRNMPDPVRAWVLDKVVTGVRRYGRLYWEASHPEVMAEAKRMKQEDLMNRGGP